MLSPNPNVRDHINKWGYSFVSTTDHFPREKTDPLQYETDRLWDKALEKLLKFKFKLLIEKLGKVLKLDRLCEIYIPFFEIIVTHYRDFACGYT